MDNKVKTVIGSGPLAAQAPRRRIRSARLVAAALILGALGANVAAASLGVSGSQDLGVGLQDITACDADGFLVRPVSEYDATAEAFTATVFSIGTTSNATTSAWMNGACEGKNMTLVALTTSVGTDSGTTTGTLTANTAIPADPQVSGFTIPLPSPYLLSESVVKVVIQIQD